ncbi:hypothetical protein CR513_15576, partial [Mucuna pruriens]
MKDAKRMSIPCICLLPYQKMKIVRYYYADYVGDTIKRKSTSGGCYFIRSCLVSWASKKQNFIALSIVKTKYISTASCFLQLLWVKYQLEDYFDNSIFCDNISAINLLKNPIQHSKAKHIETRHNFIRDYMQKCVFDI